ncbi:MAG: L-arabinose isomerase family protein [Candidatus Humimicrobiaceae bacterium]
MEDIKIKLRVGLLPLYLKLYDDTVPEMRLRAELFLRKIEEEINKRGVTVFTAPICRIKEEFDKAVSEFEKNDLDAIVTLHLTYSPSLESLEALSKTKLPIIILDTTPSFEFGPEINPDELWYNHGIHGVQDLCSMLNRRGKYFLIEAGHWEKSDVIDKVLDDIKASFLTKKLKSSIIGRIGGPFKGMGDFDVDSEILEDTIGIKVIDILPDGILALVPDLDSDEIKKEIDQDTKNFKLKNLNSNDHTISTRMCLAVRKWIEVEKLSAFTMNFSNIGKDSGFLTIPFIEANKAMSRGIGYAGEGDVLTAALVGALLNISLDTSFIEMFCPDWKNNRIFLSHMGEININSIYGKPIIIGKNLSYLNVENTAIIVGCFKPGKAIFVNLAPIRNNKYIFIISEIEVEDIKKDGFEESVRGWITPKKTILEFLKEYSELGGTHHSALVYNNIIVRAVKQHANA